MQQIKWGSDPTATADPGANGRRNGCNCRHRHGRIRENRAGNDSLFPSARRHEKLRAKFNWVQVQPRRSYGQYSRCLAGRWSSQPRCDSLAFQSSVSLHLVMGISHLQHVMLQCTTRLPFRHPLPNSRARAEKLGLFLPIETAHQDGSGRDGAHLRVRPGLGSIPTQGSGSRDQRLPPWPVAARTGMPRQRLTSEVPEAFQFSHRGFCAGSSWDGSACAGFWLSSFLSCLRMDKPHK